MRIRTKKHRLPEAAYYGDVTVAFTACEVRRHPIFTSQELIDAFVAELSDAVRMYRCEIPIYCFMPDHLHVIVRGLDMSSRPKLVMERFKHQTGNWLRNNRPSVEWQDDFYDHIIRKSEDWRSQVQYIASNPVRAGLVEDMFAYPHNGSVGCNWHDVLVNTIV